ncbi:Homoserine dehydrogenase OS=Lysinibacillus sphaericus OX=1421 GN=hom PE=3 SV=1 [Lysinibacillus sphaericus]
MSGQDAFKKLMILSALAFGEQPDWADVEVIGIDCISAEQVKDACEKGLRYRHVAEVEKLANGKVVAKAGHN